MDNLSKQIMAEKENVELVIRIHNKNNMLKELMILTFRGLHPPRTPSHLW